MRFELAAEIAGRLDPPHAAALRGEEGLENRRAEAPDGVGGLVEVLGDRGRRHRQSRAHELARHPIPIHRDAQAIRGTQHRNARGLQVAQHLDALLDAPSIRRVAELLDHGAGEPLQRLAAVEETSVRQSETARGQVDDGGLDPGGAQRVHQPLGGPRAGLADDGELHAASAVARSSRRTPCRKIDRANSKSATTRPEVMNERACDKVSRVSK